ncbi:MAG TPA: LysE family transporter [Ottowia sp.]|uniref:LysE family translocator n=1 Tax=Ottowia sp. TaxID=1898956 RepID=UPI002BA1168B|nr:LysE family transporter [Ottowia sp.]HMN21347.1 LysE family transporter [Ottowia sp.]
MSAAEFSALLLLFAAATFTPGPNTTLATALAANRGLRGSLHFVCAVPAGWVVLLLLCGVGLGALVLALPALRWGILGVGVAYMLWLAARLARSGTLGQADARQLDVSFLEGVGLQFLNVKVWLLALTAVAGWVVGHPDWLARLAWTLALMVVFGFSSNFTYALVGSLLRGWLARGRRLLWFNRLMALALVLTAAWMAWSALAIPAPELAG